MKQNWTFEIVSKDKIYNTNRQLNIIKDNLKKFPNSVLEVSLLNDYNLKKYKLCGAQKVEGLEPNKIISEAINKNMFVATAYPGTEMFNDKSVKKALFDGFGIEYINGKPKCDSSLERYVEQLNDATDLIYTDDGNLLQYSKMADSLFLEIREIISSGNLFDILEL